MNRAAPFTFDDSLWPLLGVRLTGELSRQEFEAYLDRSTQYLQRGERHVCIFDLSALWLLSSEQRQRHALWLEKNAALMRRTLLGLAYVITSPTVVLTMSVIFHFRPPPVPYTLVTRLDAARAWAAWHLEESGLGAQAERVRSHLYEGMFAGTGSGCGPAQLSGPC
ncbi:STAS/SEC14 domain-containing protein [Archangium violaceum]|nr:STAS/SEC14 domain-containing protein [Archangium violaceum]